MKLNIMALLLCMCVTCGSAADAAAQQTDTGWTLRECIEYARQNNLNVETQRVGAAISQVELSSAKAQRYPTLSFSTSHNVSHQNQQPLINDYGERSTGGFNYSGNYSLTSGLTLYNGGRLRNTVRQQELDAQSAELDVEQAQNDIEIEVAQAFMQILYARETLDNSRAALATSLKQVERAREMLATGAIARSDLMQLEAQYSNDAYTVVMDSTAVTSALLTLSQLLELAPGTEFDIVVPTIDDASVLAPLESAADIYASALETMPQMQSNELAVESSLAAEKIARASFYPTLSLNVGLSTGAQSNTGISYLNQMSNKFYQNAGISLNIPIFNGRQARNNVSQARLNTSTVRLQAQSARNELWNTVSSLHNDATAAQAGYLSAERQLESARASYELVEAQFNEGLKNTVELLTERNNYDEAVNNLTRAKYTSLLAASLLRFYAGSPIEI